MRLLEQLAGITPRGKRTSVVQAVIAGHADEIEAARELGYSWWDIAKAAMAAWADEWPSGYKLRDGVLQKFYREALERRRQDGRLLQSPSALQHGGDRDAKGI